MTDLGKLLDEYEGMCAPNLETCKDVARAALESHVAELRERAEKAEFERDYFVGYEADLRCIDKVLNEHNAPHDCEDGVSLAPKRIRLLAEQRDQAEAKLSAVHKAAGAYPDSDLVALVAGLNAAAKRYTAEHDVIAGKFLERAEKAEAERDAAVVRINKLMGDE